MQCYFIRHGQSENNELWARTGAEEGRSDDAELTALGRLQAERVARLLNHRAPLATSMPSPVDGQDPRNLRGYGITHLYCSPMVRAVATGTVIAQTLGVPLAAWVDLHEEGGIWLGDPQTGERVGQPGKNRTYFEQHYPGMILPDSMDDAGWWNRPFEQRDQRPDRAQRVLEELIVQHAHTDDRVALISHGGFFNHFMTAVLRLPSMGPYRFNLSNTGFARIDFADQRIRVQYTNCTNHLSPEMITE
jgi:2,3-bisphosphoglycerate-dependent phosphoglycerate mutase